jgi:hypothetical protein
VLVDGKPVAVPGNVGIDQARSMISPLHTHDTSGVLHIESPVQASFSLGQFFSEWQVALDQDHLGSLAATGGKVLRAYVNGKQVPGNPAAIILHAHDEVALVYGSATDQTPVPPSYNFEPGL